MTPAPSRNFRIKAADLQPSSTGAGDASGCEYRDALMGATGRSYRLHHAQRVPEATTKPTLAEKKLSDKSDKQQ